MNTEAGQKLLTDLLHALGASFESIEFVAFPAHPLLNIITKDSPSLIGPHGDHLQALNVVFRRLCEHSFGRESEKYLIDVNGYQHKQLELLQQNAKMLAERVRSLHTRAELSPMNAYERMVIHATFSDDPEVGTISEGEGHDRHIVLVYKGVQDGHTL